MEQLIQAFGIDVRLIVIQIINFGILMALLSYFLYKPVLKLLREREERIVQGIKDAEAAAVAKNQAESDKQAVLAAAQSEAVAVAERAKAHADATSEETLTEARTKAAAMIADAEARGEDIKKQAQKESEAEIAKLAILAAEKVLRSNQAS
jgi:F-type H+-transporting ATPase subunit b